MSDKRDEFERRLTERLRASEARVPAGAAPPLDAPDRPLHWGLVLAGGVGGAGVVAAALAIALLQATEPPAGEGSPSPSPTPSATPSAIESTAPATPEASETPPASAPLGVAWDTDVLPIQQGMVNRVTAVGGSAYALGADGANPVLWSSGDGVDWERTDLPWPDWAPHEPGVSVDAEFLVELDGGLVAIGRLSGPVDNVEPIVWRGNGSGEWSVVPRGGFAAAFTIWGVATGANGVVAVSHGFAGPTGSAWLSPDGVTWTEHRPDDRDIEVFSVLAAGGRYLLGGLFQGGDPGFALPALWTSVDGVRWEAIELELSGRTGYVTDLARDGAGTWLARGAVGGEPVAWTSSDGSSWQLAAGPTGGRTEPFTWQGVSTLVGLPHGFLELDAGYWEAVEPAPFRLFGSRDGVAWEEQPIAHPNLEGGVPGLREGVALLGSRMIVVGNAVVPGDVSPDLPQAAGWFAWGGTVQE